MKLTWYDGGLKPPRLEELEAGAALPDEGLVFIGERGKILCRFNGGRPRLVPEERMRSYRQPAKTLPRSPGNVREWLEAAKGKKEKPGASTHPGKRVHLPELQRVAEPAGGVSWVGTMNCRSSNTGHANRRA